MEKLKNSRSGFEEESKQRDVIGLSMTIADDLEKAVNQDIIMRELKKIYNYKKPLF